MTAAAPENADRPEPPTAPPEPDPQPATRRNGRGTSAGFLLFILLGSFLSIGCLCHAGAVMGQAKFVLWLLMALRLFAALVTYRLTWRLLGVYSLIYLAAVFAGDWLVIQYGH